MPWLAPAGDGPCWTKDQAIGEACGRSEAQMQQCLADFGAENLPQLCRTCPGPGR
jgi:hypothetical protein